MIHYERLEQKIESLKSYKHLNRQSIDNFFQEIQRMSDWDLFRINPIKFATEKNLNQNETIDLFIHSAKVGIFDFNYNMICPGCGGVVSSHNTIAEVESDHFYCAPCDLKTKANLDDMVEVSFTLQPSIKKLEIDQFSTLENYVKYNYSANLTKRPETQRLMQSAFKEYFYLEPNASKTIDVLPDSSFNFLTVVSVENNTTLIMAFDPSLEPSSNTIEIDLMPSGFVPNSITLSAKGGKVLVKNLKNVKAGFVFTASVKCEIVKDVNRYLPKVGKFLTAKDMLNNQSFRELYRIQDLTDNLNLNVRSLTILFTDLRGSTEMYDKAGDHIAYSLVQEHFDVLIKAVRDNSGAIVKTMGDAIMATFSSPLDGFLAALSMMEMIHKLNENWKSKGHEIGLKVGLHEGAALAVNNDERLDYFGQSVNIAARVQGLAKAGEIWITDPIYKFPGIDVKIADKNLKVMKQEASLKGVGEKAIVYCLTT